MLVSKLFTFDAAHQLPDYDGPCRDLHGHTFHLTVTIRHPVQEDGLAYDFGDLKKVVKEHVVDRLDHSYLNDLIRVPSAENLTLWIWRTLSEVLPVELHEIKLAETPTSYVTYRGEE